MSGNLIVRPLSARLTHGTELFGKMDPLVKVIVGSHVQRTPAMKRGHKNPTWDTELSLRRTNEDIIRFEVWDKDILTKNDLIGAGELPFARVFALNGMFKDWIPLTYKNKSAGELLVSLEFIPDYGVNLNDESARIGTMTGPTMGTMGTSNMPLQNTQNLGVVNTQPLMTSQIPNEYMAGAQPITQPIVSPQMMTSTTQTMQPLAGTQGNLPLSSERGFAPQSLPTGQVFTDPLDSLERARERDEGFVPGGIGRKEERLEQAGHKDERFFDRTRDNIDRHMDRNLERRDPYLQENLRTAEVRPGENYYGRGSFIPDQYRLQQEQYRAEMIRSQSAMPGYSNGIVGYHPVSSSDGRWIYEPRIDERAFDRIEERGFDRMPLQQQDFTRQQATIQQIPMQQNYTQQPLMSQQFQGQPQYGYTQQENVHPSLRQDLTNIENRIKDKAHEMRPLSSSNYENPLARNKTGYQREQREYVPILPESKMSTIPQSQTITTQLPGVISNPESRYEGGKFVTHQGGTHSTVGSVQSHRIISRMADKPDQGINALDEDARIALGDVPRSYYGDKGTTTTK